MGDLGLPRLDDEPATSSRQPTILAEGVRAEATLRVGDVLASKYRLEEVLGSGGMAHVYRATNLAIGRTVAVKMMRGELASSSPLVERFLREARTANLVRHPNVVDVIDVGTDEGGAPFLVQEYLVGETLLDFSTRHAGALGVVELAEIMGPVLSAVTEAHARGVVHRDLKPENVFLAVERGRRVPKVLDFGISKVRSSGLEELTTAGALMGTPAYMAPELAREAREADARTDVWALGVLVFEVLTGQVPFAGDSVPRMLLAIATTPPARLSDVRPGVPASISRVVERCLRRNPDERYANASELAEDLGRALSEVSPEAIRKWSLAPAAATKGPEEITIPRAPPTGEETRAPSVATNETAAPNESPRGGTLVVAQAPSPRPRVEPKAEISAAAEDKGERALPMRAPSNRKARAAAIYDAPLRADAGPAERMCRTSTTRTFRGRAPVVWAILSDTNRWDRAVGMPPTTYAYEELEPMRRVRVGETTIRGVFVRWVEVGEWLEGRLLWGERRFLRGWVTRAGYHVELEAEKENQTRVTVAAYSVADSLLGWLVAFLWRLRFQQVMRRYLDGLQETLATASDDLEHHDRPGPASMNVRAAFAQTPPAAILRGKGVLAARSALDAAARRLDEQHVDREIATRIVEHIARRSDEEVSAMRPFELADGWRIARRAVLHTFVQACRAGMTDLVWHINCPRCRVGAAIANELDALTRQSHCDECGISFDVDFAQNVEAVFRPNSGIRTTKTAVYCAGSPWFRPHVMAAFHVGAASRRKVSTTLPEAVLLRVQGKPTTKGVLVSTEDSPFGHVTVTISSDGIVATVAPCASDEAGLTISNTTDRSATMLVERSGWESEFVRGSLLLTMPNALDLFATAAPATGLSVSVGAATVLFTDLTGSTALYERLGDARAFGIVQQHFRETAALVVGAEGTIVKTMGDAVMAMFPSARHALRAAIAIVKRAGTDASDQNALGVKVGFHTGPCLMVRANDRIDVFGTTVNLASRLQARARAGEVVMLESMWDELAAAGALDDEKLKPARFRAVLRGLSAERALVAIDPTGKASLRPGSKGPSGRS